MEERKSVIWGYFAERQFKKALEYHYEISGNLTYSNKIIDKPNQTINLIIEYNNIGISIFKTNFRSILVFDYAIVYEVLANQILIVLFWNTKRNPKNLEILLKELS
jgi:hypothetical protein